ncbi:TPA: hypothetical protein DF272_00370 [Candidatus Falkowbacteria bacterium]|nr:hypothetical protein [Candidatus Falkowbacteria bacterium]
MNPFLFFTLVWIGARYGTRLVKCRTQEDWKVLLKEIKDREFVKPLAATTAAVEVGIERADAWIDQQVTSYSESLPKWFDTVEAMIDKNFEQFSHLVDEFKKRWQPADQATEAEPTKPTEPKDQL